MNVNNFMSLMFHEATHIMDAKRNRPLYFATYNQETVLGIPLLVLALVLFGFKSWIAAIALLILAAFCFLPTPKPGRFYWELRGFAANVHWIVLLGHTQETLAIVRIWAAKEMQSKKYYFIWPFESHIKKLLETPRELCSFPKEMELFLKEDFKAN